MNFAKKRLEEERKLRSSSASHSSASSGGLSIDLSETSSGGMDLYHLDQLARQRSIDLSETSSGADSAEDARVSVRNDEFHTKLYGFQYDGFHMNNDGFHTIIYGFHANDD